MAVESLDQSRRQSDSTLPSMYTNFERAAREGEQFHRRHASESISTMSPVSPTSYCPSFAKYQSPVKSASNPYATPPDSRKNSEPDEKRHVLPSLREVGLAPSSTSILNPPHSNGGSYHSHTSLPPVHSLSSVQPPQPSQSNGYQHPTPTAHPAEQRYEYSDGRSGYNQGPAPVHPNPEPYTPRQNSYSQIPSSQYPRPSISSSHSSFNGPLPASAHQYTHGPTSQPPSSQPSYPPSTMPPPYGPPYHHDTNGPNASTYSQGGSPTSKILGKRPSTTTYGGLIERALHMSSMRRDLENSRTHSWNIHSLVKRLCDRDSEHSNHGLEHVLSEFHKAVRDAEELKEGLEGCRKLLSEMCKEQEQQSVADKRPHIPEYEVEEHVYPEDPRTVGLQQPELKKVRRGRAAPPGRCHSCHRAETPEWRRGPDGARTLCNACGLHYAKLTRKMSKSNNLAANTIARKSPNAALP